MGVDRPSTRTAGARRSSSAEAIERRADGSGEIHAAQVTEMTIV
jgi:hypothetical protein